ncbi:NAD(P)H-binding protein [Rhizobium sp. BK376]|uniref:NAD(P)-dependent oxidoreductase n=1 Tax=Rhizobium sp. BK376 TaxID=2512149 RepID=UPI001045CFB8|nr:NAD(P)H-binding protein [Rhizobium sp. BK376]TCR67898.1 putative NADH-flavin reductase [Rhizobium sp. BK376]
MTVIALLGGSGRLGCRVYDRLRARGCHIRVLAHKSRIAGDAPHVTQVHGDVHDPAIVAELLDGASMVVSTLGAAGSPTMDVCSAAMRNLIPVMTERSITRIVTTTGSAARLDLEVGQKDGWQAARRAMLMRHMAPLILDGEEHMRLLQQSALDWTTLRLPIMRGGLSDAVKLSDTCGPPEATLGYDAVAQELIRELFSARWVGAAPFAVEA